MRPEEILATAALVLDRTQREAYFETGYLLLPEFLDRSWLDRLREVAAEFVEQSRACSKSDAKFDLEPGHSADAPKLRRLSFPVDHHEIFRELAVDSPIVDIAQDLLGPTCAITTRSLTTNGVMAAKRSSGIRTFKPGRTPIFSSDYRHLP